MQQEHLLDFLVLVLDPDPGRPVPSVDPALPLDEGRGQLDGPVEDLLHAEALAVVLLPAERVEVVALLAPVPEAQVSLTELKGKNTLNGPSSD